MEINYSFIIPHKNSPQLLNRCLDSIPQRTDIEIIVVDDNSDAGKKPCIEREDVEVIMLDAARSQGAGRARNIGMERATGQWLLFADADDFYAPGFLSVLDCYKERNLDILYFSADSVQSDTLAPAHRTDELKEFIRRNDGSRETVDAVKYKTRAPWFKMLSAVFVKNYGFQYEETPKGNDIFFSYMTGYFARRIEIIPDMLYVYTMSPTSMSFERRGKESWLCSLTNGYKIDAFADYIGHPEWKRWPSPLFRTLPRILQREGFTKSLGIFWYFFKKRKTISRERMKYVEAIEKIKTEYGALQKEQGED